MCLIVVPVALLHSAYALARTDRGGVGFPCPYLLVNSYFSLAIAELANLLNLTLFAALLAGVYLNRVVVVSWIFLKVLNEVSTATF